ncbi:methyl-accepting chemotaxis protein [Fervidobacterium nodosum]|uniref:Methyl-accepting chemotaxis sensory transducer n=1 Tax=Fervidobacterium nodosum (strain ATCC 35602 / DSM 5306 / Rt17-B1) TaxID=381764 RepID=A7HMZ6_FERNB|nr:methyl-accepting chemotaxis protein [Fervidobacterium nodosum]ABS61279.1 methyl-accepting chemotaxis sensory transducer [Fervidobacterium nodosum Rt17-B1]
MLGFYNKSLKMRIAVLFGLIVLIGCLILFFISENQAGKALEAEAKEAMLKVAKQLAETQNSRIQAKFYIIEMIANRNIIRGIWGEREATLEEKINVIKSEAKKGESLGFKQFGIADKQGNAFLSDGSKANISDKEYFKEALSGKTVVSSSLISKVDNSLVFVCATPIRHYKTNEIIGVLFGVIDGTSLSDPIKSVTYAKTGYAFAVDATGKTIAHKEIERVLKQENIIDLAKQDQSLVPLANIVSKMTKGEEGIGEYTFKGVREFIAYSPIGSTGWSIAVVAPASEILARASGLSKFMLITSIIIIIIAVLLILLFTRSITTPLIVAVNHLGVIANGDFTMPVPEIYLKRKDEIGLLAKAIDKLQADIKPLLANLKDGVGILSTNSESLTSVSEEIAASSSEVAKAIQQVAQGASEQVNSVQKVVELFDLMAQNLERVYTMFNSIKENSQNASRLAEKGKKEMDLLITFIRSVRDIFNTLVEKIKNLSGSIAQVDEIINVMNGIADQTNLLALNAAIEAARAGSAGRGFAVVAEEVKKLANESRAFADKIKAILTSVTADTNKVVQASNEVTVNITAQLENVEKNVAAFDAIIEAISSSVPQIEETYKQIEGVMKQKDTAMGHLESVSTVAEENSAASEEVSASVEKLAATTEEIATSAQQIMEVAKNLETQVEKFKI